MPASNINRDLEEKGGIMMYQKACTKCGSISLHIELKGNNTGLYCDDCGAWVKWIGKDEQRAFINSKHVEAMKNAGETKEDILCNVRDKVQAWLDETGAIPKGTSYYYELLSLLC